MISILRQAFGVFQLHCDNELHLSFRDQFICRFADLQLTRDIKIVVVTLLDSVVMKLQLRDEGKISLNLKAFLITISQCISHDELKQMKVPSDRAFFDSEIVGCGLTRDRLIHANLVESDLCLFCTAHRECLSHLIECLVVIDIIGKLPDHGAWSQFSELRCD